MTYRIKYSTDVSVTEEQAKTLKRIFNLTVIANKLYRFLLPNTFIWGILSGAIFYNNTATWTLLSITIVLLGVRPFIKEPQRVIYERFAMYINKTYDAEQLCLRAIDTINARIEDANIHLTRIKKETQYNTESYGIEYYQASIAMLEDDLAAARLSLSIVRTVPAQKRKRYILPVYSHEVLNMITKKLKLK